MLSRFCKWHPLRRPDTSHPLLADRLSPCAIVRLLLRSDEVRKFKRERMVLEEQIESRKAAERTRDLEEKKTLADGINHVSKQSAQGVRASEET